MLRLLGNENVAYKNYYKKLINIDGMPGPDFVGSEECRIGPKHACSRIHQIVTIPDVPDTLNAHAVYWCRT